MNVDAYDNSHNDDNDDDQSGLNSRVFSSNRFEPLETSPMDDYVQIGEREDVDHRSGHMSIKVFYVFIRAHLSRIVFTPKGYQTVRVHSIDECDSPPMNIFWFVLFHTM